MSTVITDARTLLIWRHNIGTHSAEPTPAQIDTWLREAFRTIIAVVPSIQKGSVTLDSARRASLPEGCLSVLFVARDHLLLQDTEWQEIGAYLTVGAGSGRRGTTLGLWYLKNFEIAATTSEVDTTDIFAQDRYEEAAMTLASQQILRRLSNSSASRGGGKHAQLFRVEQQERDTLVALLQQAPNAWTQRMIRKQQAQLALGITPPAGASGRGIINHARMPNVLTGELS